MEANSAQLFDPLMSTTRRASSRGRGVSTVNRQGGSAVITHRQNFRSAVIRRCWYNGSAWTVISSHLPPPVMIDRTAVLELATHMLCCNCAICFSTATSSENDHGNMNFASKTAPEG